MSAFVSQYGGTVLVCLALAAAVAAILRGMIRDKRSGKGACGGDCSRCAGCAMGRTQDQR